MASTLDIKLKLNNVKGVQKITKAMELVSAVKMQKIKQYIADSDDYIAGLRKTIGDITQNFNLEDNKYLSTNSNAKDTLIIFIGTSRGFVGSLNTKLGIEIYNLTKKLEAEGKKYTLVTLKNKSIGIIGKHNISSNFHFPENFEDPNPERILSIKSILLEKLEEGNLEGAYIVYPKFISMSNQSAVSEKLLPLTLDNNLQEKSSEKGSYIFEPDAKTIIDRLFTEYLEITLYRAVLEAATSEYAARMRSMHNATENAEELIENLNVLYNKTRQSTITKQIQENINANLANISN